MIKVLSPFEVLLNKIEKAFCGLEDLDILVSRQDLYKAEGLASKFGFIKVNSPNYKADTGVEDFLFLSDDGKWFHLHVHYQAVFGNGVIRDYHIPLESYLFSRALRNVEYNVNVICPEDDLCFFLLRHLVRKSKLIGYVNFKDELEYLLNFYRDENLTYENSDVFPEEIIGYLKLEDKSKESIEDLRRVVLKKLKFTLYSTFLSALENR